MALDLLKRAEKGTLLTAADHDTNFTNIETEVNGKAEAVHTHLIADVTDAGTAASEDVGTALGNVVQLEDVGGGTPGLPAVDGSQLSGLAGGGDMVAAVYDPTAVADDAFDMDNMVEGADTLILTAAERALIATALQPDDALENSEIASGTITPRVGNISFAVGGSFLENRTIGIEDGNLLEVDGTPAAAEFAVFTATGINGLSAAEAKASLAITVVDITDAGTMAQENADDYTLTEHLGALALVDSADGSLIDPGAVSGHHKWGDVQNEPAPVANVSTISLADDTDHLILTNGDTETLVINEPVAARNLTILNTTGNDVEIQDDQLSTIYAALGDDHLLILVYTGSGWDVKADINTVGGGSVQQPVLNGTAAGDNITEITAALLGTTTYKIVQFDQAMALDNALPASTAFALWNVDTDPQTVTIEAGAGGNGEFDDGETTVVIPPNGVVTFVVISNAGDEPQVMKRGDPTEIDFQGRPVFGGLVPEETVGGVLDNTHIGKDLTTNAAITVPTTTGWWAVVTLGAATHDIGFNSLNLDVSGQGWGTGDVLGVKVKSATTIRVTRIAAADIVTQAAFAP